MHRAGAISERGNSNVPRGHILTDRVHPDVSARTTSCVVSKQREASLDTKHQIDYWIGSISEEELSSDVVFVLNR